ncbi:hypothetical protein DNU06_10145 [Putridiphycobacter roseus]|uniref:Type IX secretion system membrane protein PorP/SprF n=1 Tax=Putridiphycobacter roseus TaxID=2219161 RepID=A0A2W1N064_9FLAO|nr:PorP/SprF family type IX secretion system membrane protein [Putridiphycobacter roseus]PZE17094.1 hypothetical protein DNU06_10145 [Putridiphycobacter roseus]
MMKRKLILLTFIVCVSGSAFAQIDKHFSMYDQTKIQINPAAAGFFDAKYKVFANYREQWRPATDPPLQTYSATFDTRLYEDRRKGKYVGAGLILSNDVGGDGSYTQLQVAVPINYSLRIGELHYLSFGISPGYFQRSVESSDLVWSSQWEEGIGFDNTLQSGELLLNDRYSVGAFDIGAGLYYEYAVDEYRFMTVGVSSGHLTRPKVQYTSVDERMSRTLNFHYFGNFGKADFPLTFKPSVMWGIQGPNQYLVFGSRFDILLSRGDSQYTGYYNRTSIEIGAHFRMQDALIASCALNKGGFTAGVSYDFTMSQMRTITKSQGATEFFISYKMGKSKGRGQLDISEDE